MPTKINFRLYEIDNCLFHTHPSALNEAEENIQVWLVENNRRAFDTHVDELKKASYRKVIVGHWTDRVDYHTDEARRKLHGGTFAPVLPIVQHYFSANLSHSEVLLDPFLPADLYGTNREQVAAIQAGDSYRGILLARYHSNFDVKEDKNHNEAVADPSKISTLYAYVQRIAKLNPEDEIDIDLYDNQEVIKGLHIFYKKNPQLLPKKIMLRLHEQSHAEKNFYEPISGTGEIDHHFDWSTRYMSAYFQDIMNAADLEKYHKDKAYPVKMRKNLADIINADLNFVAKFAAFRADEAPKLETNPGITSTANYTTAATLAKDDVLPKMLLKIPENYNIISDAVHQQITACMNRYIMARGTIVNSNAVLNWTSFFFRNSKLTTEKLNIAQSFVKDLEKIKDINIIKDMVNNCIDHNRQSEMSNEKNYGCFTSSGLLRTLIQIQAILRREETRLSINKPSHLQPRLF